MANGHKITALERPAEHLLSKYRTATKNPLVNGMTLDDLSSAEHIFQKTIQVYSLVPTQDDQDPDAVGVVDGRNHEVHAELIRRSHCRYPDKLNLNLLGDHFCFIRDLQVYSRSFICSRCNWATNKASNLTRHEVACDGNVKHRFPGGGYQLSPTVFDKLAGLGIEVPDDDKFYPYRATYDFECYFQRVEGGQRGTKLTYEYRHEILTCSVASNVPAYEQTRCFVTEGTPGDVVKKLVAHLHEISRYSHVLLTEKFQPIFEQLDHLIHLDSDGDDPTHDGDSTEGTKRRRKHHAAVVKEQLDNFLQSWVSILVSMM